jgi:hypothetical protein
MGEGSEVSCLLGRALFLFRTVSSSSSIYHFLFGAKPGRYLGVSGRSMWVLMAWRITARLTTASKKSRIHTHTGTLTPLHRLSRTLLTHTPPHHTPMRLPLHHQHRMDMWSECVAKSHAIQGKLTPLHRLSRPLLTHTHLTTPQEELRILIYFIDFHLSHTPPKAAQLLTMLMMQWKSHRGVVRRCVSEKCA